MRLFVVNCRLQLTKWRIKLDHDKWRIAEIVDGGLLAQWMLVIEIMSVGWRWYILLQSDNPDILGKKYEISCTLLLHCNLPLSANNGR
jgi:hypothetical protein